MTKIEKRDQFDVDSLRRQVAQVRAREAGETVEEDNGINPFARQVADQLREGNYTPTMIIGQFRLFEFLSLVIISLGVFHLYVGFDAELFVVQASVASAVSALSIAILQIGDGYRLTALRARMRFMPRIIMSWGVPIAMLAAAATLLGAGNVYSLSMLGLWFLVGAAFLVIERVVFAISIRHWARNGIMERRAVIVGGGQAGKELIRALESQADNDIRICGIFDDRGEKRSPVVVAGYPKLGSVAELVEFARLTRIDMLIIALPMSAEARILQLLRKLWILPVDIRLAAHSNKLRFRPRAYSHVGAVPMLDIFNKPIRDWDSVAKRIFDVGFSLLALALLWPVMVGAAIAVKVTSKGPVFFMQKRHGFNNEIIKVFKFRSMYAEMADPTARNAVTPPPPPPPPERSPRHAARPLLTQVLDRRAAAAV